MKPKIASIATNLKPFNRLIKRFLILSNMSPPYDKSLMLLVSSLMQPQRESTKNKITLAIPKVKRVFIPRTKSDQKGGCLYPLYLHQPYIVHRRHLLSGHH